MMHLKRKWLVENTIQHQYTVLDQLGLQYTLIKVQPRLLHLMLWEAAEEGRLTDHRLREADFAGSTHRLDADCLYLPRDLFFYLLKKNYLL